MGILITLLRITGQGSILLFPPYPGAHDPSGPGTDHHRLPAVPFPGVIFAGILFPPVVPGSRILR
jgi:hypothetical protein